MKLSGEVAIVTGGGAGIGRAIALGMAQEGADVAVWDVNGPQAEEMASTIRQMGRKSRGIKVDVSNAQEVYSAVQMVVKEFGRIDILVNNAGICQVTPVDQIEEKDWDRMFAVNVKGVFLCSKAVMGFMMKQKSGKIINLGSLAGKVGGIATGAHYAATKAAVLCFTKSLAKFLGPHGVRVNALAPGVIETDMTRMITGGDWRNFLATIPLGRIGDVKEVAKVAVFLASDDSSYLTGETIDINGGQFMD
jgi:NAD(P)-dependent dehydrogenase (short-subunit alcohol dehydrogenase family)